MISGELCKRAASSFGRSLFLLAIAVTVNASCAETTGANYRSTLSQQLTFEGSASNVIPDGWTGSTGTVSVDRTQFHSGHAAVRLDRDAKSDGDSAVITKSIPIDFAGNKLELRGYLKTRDVAGMAGLWVREDGKRRMLQFDNMSSRHLAGTTEWTKYSIELPIDPQATQLFFGVLLIGTGTAWADDLQLLVDGQPVSAVAHIERPRTVLDTDREFVGGSGVTIETLTAAQIDSLTKLGRVWGFLKYHHPAVTTGTKHWDFELFRILPAVLKSNSVDDTNTIIADWVNTIGAVPDVPFPVKIPVDRQTEPDIAWLKDESLLGRRLSGILRHIYDNRLPKKQFYVDLAPHVGNPQFDVELSYDELKLPDAGYQLLALYRLWNIVEYWYPYRDLIGNEWPTVLRQSISEFALAKDARAYQSALLKTIANVRDTHANLWSSLTSIPPEGDCNVPAAVRFVGSKAVVAKVAAGVTGLRTGDVITGIDGTRLEQLMEKWKPYYAASNDSTVLRDMGRNMLRGACGNVSVDMVRDTKNIHVDLQRVPSSGINTAELTGRHDLPGDTFRLLTPEIAYLKLSSVKSGDVPGYIDAAATTKGIIVDIRNYPSQFVVFALGQLLVDHVTPFVRFTTADLSNPGTFVWGETERLTPAKPHYSGKIVILLDEVSVSQAEYTAMALRAAPNSIVIGSATAGADGNVSRIALPGNQSTLISGIGVFYPDKKPTQRIGIVPDIRISTTADELRDGVDAPLERAKREIHGAPAAH